MATVVPRWEWRAFGDDFAEAERGLRRADPGTGRGERRALPARRGPAPPSRSATTCMDIKVLREVNADGLERWEPVLKAGFPLPAADGRPGCSTPSASSRPRSPGTPTRSTSSSPSWSRRRGAVRPVKVHKRRVRYTVGGCMAELSDVRGGRTRHADGRGRVRGSRPRVIAAVRGVGLDGAVNTSYPRGLAALVGAGPRALRGDRRRHELGQVPHRRARRRRRVAHDRRSRRDDPPRRGPRGDGRDLGRAARADGGRDRRHGRGGETRTGVRAIAAVGTAGLRIAPQPRRRRRRDPSTAPASTVEVISGEEEGRLAYLAVGGRSSASATGSIVVFDTGGGSTQFTFGHGDARRRAVQRQRRRGRASPSASASPAP